MAIKNYVKGTATKLSDNFKSTEFDCHGKDCCLSTQVDEELVKYLQKIRNYFGKPVNITSGYRCSTHNKNVGLNNSISISVKSAYKDLFVENLKDLSNNEFIKNHIIVH